MSAPAPLKTRVAFAAGDFANNLFWTGTSLFLLYFYTDVMGLSPVAAGMVYFIAMAWDAVSDPLMGVAADRTRTRWGRFRPYLLFGAAPLAFSYPLAFWNPGFEGAALFGWALFTHCALRTAYTVVSIPYTALQSALTSDAKARAGLAGWRMLGAASGGLAVAFITPAIVAMVGADDEARGFLIAASVVGCVAIAVYWCCFAAMREPAHESAPPARFSLICELGAFVFMMRTNGPLMRIFVLVIVSSIAGTMFSKNILYFFKYNLDAPDYGRFAVLVPALMLFFAVPLWVFAAQKTSKRQVALLCATLSGLGYVAFFLNPSLDPRVSLCIMVFMGFAAAGNFVMFWAMIPDTVEYGEARTGVRHEAKVFGFASFAQKAALGVNALLLGALLDATGFVANETQAPETLDAIKAIMTLLPLASSAAAVALLWGYPIDAKYHAALLRQIEARKAEAEGNAPVRQQAARSEPV
jgi:GPH family glycoside/pentoside/hexuronide:cation symporter